MPRRVRNPGSGKPPHNGPAKGAGIGGPAKGAGVGPAKPYTAETRPYAARAAVAATLAENHDPDEQKYRQEQRRLTRERRRAAWEATDNLVADPTHKDHHAAVRDTLDRLDGRAVQKSEVSGPGGGPIETRDVSDLGKLSTAELRTLTELYRKAGLSLP